MLWDRAVCHVKKVSDFPLDTQIKVVNAPSNLIGLCPNHHWEFDNGVLSIKELLIVAA